MGMTAKRNLGNDVPAALTSLFAAARTAGEPMSGRFLARRLGVSASTVSRWRRGICTPNPVNLKALGDLVDEWYTHAVSRIAPPWDGYALAVNGAILRLVQTAYNALMTDQDREYEKRLAEDIAANIGSLRVMNGA